MRSNACGFHVRLVSHRSRNSVDLTPDRELSYWDARAILIDLGRSYPVLHEPGAVAFLKITPG